MTHWMTAAAATVLFLLLGACVGPGTPPAVDVPTAAPTAPLSPAETQAPPAAPSPSPTSSPTPTQAVESEPAGAAGPQAVVAIALETTAGALGVAPDTVQLVSIEAVQWPDSCLGVSVTDQACAEVITPGYRIVVEAGGMRYAVHTNEDGSAVRFAGPQEPPAAAIPGDLGMAWNSSSEPCQSAVITPDTISFGVCGGPMQDTPLASQDLAADLAYYTSLYAPFEAQTPAGLLDFYGAGPAVATPAEQRMMVECAQLADLPSELVWVDRLEDVPRGDYERVAGSGAAVQVGAIVPQEDGTLQVPGSIFIAPLAAGGQTYILQFVDGKWKITGKAGPVWMS